MQIMEGPLNYQNYKSTLDFKNYILAPYLSRNYRVTYHFNLSPNMIYTTLFYEIWL